MTPHDASHPRPPSGPSSPASPADASPTRERSSSLSPAPSPHAAPTPAPAASRQSTPLSELSPPPDDFDDDAPKHEDTFGKPKDAVASAPTSPPSKPDDHDPKQPQHSSHLMPVSSPSTRPSPPVDSIATPSAAGTEPTSPTPGDPKVTAMLELNEELLKVCMEFQKRRIALSEPQFQAYSARLQSNLAWSASVVDQSRQQGSQTTPLPIMEPPPPVDFFPTERIQELYIDLPTIFAKEIARRSSTSSSPLSLKRDRVEDITDQLINKRRDTGESKMLGSMMPPPSIPSPGPMTNGMGTPPVPSQLGDPSMAPQNPAMMGDLQSRDRARQAQLRAAQANRQMSPPSNPNPNINNGPPGNNMNAVAGPSGAFNISAMPTHVQQMYGVLQNPAHPFVQYMIRKLPGFQTMPVPMQLQKMLATQSSYRAQHNRDAAMGPSMSPMSNNGAGGPFPGQPSPVSPIAQMGGAGQSPQNPMFPMNAGMDLRAMNSTPLPGGGGGGPMNMAMNGMTPQQRQLLLMQQQQRGGMANMNPGMGMSPQQMAFAQQEQRMRMEQQQRMAAAQQGGSATHPGSPMMSNDFPTLRSNSSIPGIARIARSPSDGSQGSMTPRMAPARGPSMGAEDYQRAMMQQRGMQGQNAGFSPQQFQQQQQQQTANWQQNQMQQQQAMQMHGGGGGGSGYGIGVGRPGSGYGGAGGAPSPPGSGHGGQNQNWGQGQGGAPGYPFAGSPGANAEQIAMQRHLSGTPVPHMQQNASPPTDGDFDPFNWA
ncbi:hypothetical protein B0H10DRAFT_2429314 [Mycena sp. CBHHK59/15]|nr:hypothetical protein B0H10DRAFT_2429314 [Mycena sp. CBHHK59/15]